MKVTPINKCSYVADRSKDAFDMRKAQDAHNDEIKTAEVVRAALYRESYIETYTSSARVRMENRLGMAFSGFCCAWGLFVMVMV